MKTAMQQHISDLETMLEDEYYEIAKQAITNCLICANSYLEYEKENIKQAFRSGLNAEYGSWSENYFEDTFN